VSPTAIDQHAHVAPALELVDAERIVDTIEWLEDMGTRYYRSDAGRNAALALQEQWEGYDTGRSDFSVTRFEHSWEQDSVIASIEGSVLPNEIGIIGGHLDSINRSDQSVARSNPLRHRVALLFVGWLPDVVLFPIAVRWGDSIRFVPRNRGNTLLLDAPAVQMELARR